jgi:hypothetical protein
MTDTVETVAEEMCRDCKFWRRRSDERGKRGGGYCVRFPPFAPAKWMGSVRKYSNATDIAFVQSDDYANDAWPMVDKTSWCGEYVRKL